MLGLRNLILILAMTLAAGCSGPFLLFPGGRLQGQLVEEPVADWSFVKDRFMHLETRPDDPYSVIINYTVKEGRLYIDPAEDRRWLAFIRVDPRVRARFGGKVYPLVAVRVEAAGELEGFAPDRFVYRLESREPTR